VGDLRRAFASLVASAGLLVKRHSAGENYFQPDFDGVSERLSGFTSERPHFFGSHPPVHCGPEKIVRVGDALASQNGVLSGEPEHPAMETSVSRATRRSVAGHQRPLLNAGPSH
jgi:hypothetical protein